MTNGSTSPEEILADIAARVHAPIKKRNDYDYDAAVDETGALVRGSGLFTGSFRTDAFGWTCDVRASAEAIRVEGPLTDFPLHISVNRRSSLLAMNSTPFTIGERHLPVFAPEPNDLKRDAIPSGEAATLIGEIIRTSRDLLHLSRFQLVGYLFWPTGVADIEKRIRCMGALSACLSAGVPPVEWPVPRLPEAFAMLQEAANRWAISDGEELQDALEEATESELRQLVDIVSPFFRQMTEYALAHKSEDGVDELMELADAADIAQQLLTR